MPFTIIRNDITKVKADAIVNTANPLPQFAGGTDSAIYKAAGAEELLAERKKAGRINPGEAAATPAFRLPAKYIIHTVGPEWIDGRHGEPDILRSCYRHSMILAEELGCESIAFPLISAGIYGFPKEHAMKIALSAIRSHLETSDMFVTLVVFGQESVQIASDLTGRIEEYIDDRYMREKSAEEYGSLNGFLSEYIRRNIIVGSALPPMSMLAPTDRTETDLAFGIPTAGTKKPSSEDIASPDKASLSEEEEAEVREAPVFSARKSESSFHMPMAKRKSLEDVVNNLGESFQQRLLRMIDERGLTDPQVYKRANIDRKLFSKIRCHEDYIPRKKTIVAIAIALKLNLDDTKDLLASAGLALANNSKSDLIVSFCIENGIYDIYEVNTLLFQFRQPILC